MSGILRATWKYVLLPIIAAFFVFNLLQSPKYSGSIEILPQKYNPIVIKRDQNGIPSIESKTLKDTMYGLGYAQGQDRLWSIHTRKLLVSGRLSELAGEKTLAVDKFFRNVAIRRYCEYAIEHIDQDTKDLLQAFADGLNDYVASAKILPLEFWITWQSFEPFQIVDSLTNAKFVAFFLTFDFQFEFIMETLEEVLGKEKTAELMPYQGEKYLWNDIVVMNDDELKQAGIYEKFQETNPYTAVQGSELPEERRPPKVAKHASAKESAKPAAGEPVKTQPKAEPEAAKKTQEQPQVKTQEKKAANTQPEDIGIKMPEAQVGSNAWVIHGSLTETGKPILANDPHLMNSIPTVWYQSSVFYGDNKFASGVGFVGFPGIHIGRNNYVSWGVTTLLSDTSDLFIMQIKDNKYFYEGEWHNLREFKEKIYVKGRKEPVEITVYESHHGVILDHYFPDMFIIRNFRPKEGQRYALAWPGYHKVDTAYKSFFDMARGQSVQEVTDGWKDASHPAFSLLLASESGDIGFVGLGKIPIRKHAREGMKPRDGSLQENDWLGYVPWESQPKIINPKKGYIVSANNKMASDNIKYGTSANMFPTTRAARIDEMIRDLVKQNKKISVEDVIRMQHDTLDVPARDVTPIMIELTKQAIKKGYATEVDHQILQDMLNKLSTWDYMSDKESIAATIFNVWERYLLRKMIKKVGIKPEDATLLSINYKFEHFLFGNMLQWKNKITRDHDLWCLNDENEGKADPCLYNLARSLEESWTFLNKKLGADMEDWQWGNLHTMEYPHGTFGPTPLKSVFHRSVPTQGNGRTVDVSRMKQETDSYGGVWSPNLKMVISMRKGDKNYFVVDTGISESVLSHHYDDQLHLVANGQYLEMALEKRSEWKNALYLNPKSK